MSDDFFNELNVKVDHNLKCCTSNAFILASKIEKFLLHLSPRYVIVYGDTNTSLAAALAAKKTNAKIIHIEAGLRCFDKSIVEERNRIKIDSISDYLFAPTELNKVFLKFENIPDSKISVTGNLIVDVCKKYSNIPSDRIHSLPDNYLLLTLHRQENVDNPVRLKILCELLSKLDYSIVLPIHPRTRNNLNRYNIVVPSNVKIIEPVGYSQFLHLLKNSILVMTDSGGVQEEAVVLKRPCLTLRSSTERQETILIGANRLFYPFDKEGKHLKLISNAVRDMLYTKIPANPYGKDVTKKMLILIGEILGDEHKKIVKQELVAA